VGGFAASGQLGTPQAKGTCSRAARNALNRPIQMAATDFHASSSSPAHRSQLVLPGLGEVFTQQACCIGSQPEVVHAAAQQAQHGRRMRMQ
jgi:hypothetical protein